jgi:hypothetical protein
VVQQGPPSREGRPPASGRPGGWSDGGFAGDDDEEYPPWAGPGAGPRWADHDERERRRLRGAPGAGQAEAERRGNRPGPGEQAGRSRPGRSARGRAAARARRGRRAMYIWGGALVAVLLIVGGVGYELLHRPSSPPAPADLVTTFQRGELKTVPNACTTVTAATLNQYLPGNRHTVAPQSLDGNAQSLCSWSLDAKPRYRVLQVTVQAYAPSGLASGNGSATFAAKDAYQQAGLLKTHPPKATHLRKATLAQVPGLGSSAFAALQVAPAGGNPTNLLTVVVRDHNVLITVVAQGPARTRRGYAAVPPLELQAAAEAAARDIVAQIR